MTHDPARLPGPDRERSTPHPERRDASQGASRATGEHGVPLGNRCRLVIASLRDALGPDGCSALLGRALDECEAKHPVLTLMRGPDAREIQLDRVSAGIEAYGMKAAEAGIDAMFASLTGILERLVGADMARRLMDMHAGDDRSREETE